MASAPANATFASSFWTTDYAAGLGVLFGKLQQGVQENEQLLAVARLRADAEETYGQKLGDIEGATARIEGGFQRDDGASVKKAYDGARAEMAEAARNHRKIAANIRELVVVPFGRWCDQHAGRVQNSQDDLQNRIKAHDRQAETTRQYRSAYYNKCRRVEDLDEEEKLAFQDPSSTAATGSPKTVSVPSISVEEEDEEDDESEPVELGERLYEPEALKKLLIHILDTIRIGETKVPILGTYQNISTGADITEYIQKNMEASSVAYAERIGQDLIDNGLLRLVGNIGSTFANSSKMTYQWRTKTFQITGIPEKRPKVIGRTSTLASMSSESGNADSPVERVSELLSGWNPLTNSHPNETPAAKLRREAREADERYKAAVRKLDGMRCNLEESMVDHLKFMERCELDRLKAVKSVLLDFSGAISNVIPSLQSTVDNMMLFQETVQPLNDLRYLLENYRTGTYCPKVVTYENYYNRVEDQTFGVDIEARAKNDRKRVPLIITTLLTFLDSHYPDLEGDDARRGIWLVDVPLAATHHLRNQINTGKPPSTEVLEKYEVPIVAAVLKLYMLELPDSLVSSHVYEIIKTIYTTTAQTTADHARVQVIQSTLGQLRLANIATLDAIITHFTRLIELTNADEKYINNLANTLAPCVLRPRQENSLTINEKFNVRLIRDLLAHKDAIFGELKRQSALTHTNSGNTRPARAISMDESRRREHMEARQKAIAAAQAASTSSPHARQPSPSPSVRGSASGGLGHRREKSRGPETRFPVTVAATQSPSDKRAFHSPSSSSSTNNRNSLGVPQTPPSGRQIQTALSLTDKSQSPPFKPSNFARTQGSLFQPPPHDTSSDVGDTPEIANGNTETATEEKTSDLAPGPPLDAKKEDAITSNVPTYGRDGLSRSSGRSLKDRKSAVGLDRSKENNVAEDKAASASVDDSADSPRPKGVQLEDKPMDFD